MKRARDQQKSKVYTWEQGFRDKEADKMSLAECKLLIKKAVSHYRLKEPRLADGRGCRNALYSAHKYTITLPKWARMPEVVLHETAHLITGHLFREAPAHGREFVGVFMYLLSKYTHHSNKTLAKSANDARVDFLSAVNCKPPRKS
jgi:hypothetical protein